MCLAKPAPTLAPVIPEYSSESGGLINPSNLRQRSFVPLLKRAALPRITFHDLRPSYASLLFSKHVHPKFVRELLGHASVAITLDTYSYTLPGMGILVCRTSSYRINRDAGASRTLRDFLRSLAMFIRLSHRSVPSNLALKELLP